MTMHIHILLYSCLAMDVPQFLPLVLFVTVLVVFVSVLVANRMILRRVRQRIKDDKTVTDMMQKAVEISANNVVRYNVRDGFIYNLFGNVFPGLGVTVAEWKKHVHPDDFEDTLEWFHQILDGGLKRAEFYYRWDYNFDGEEHHWGYMHNVSVPEYRPGTKRVINIISTLKDETEKKRQEQEEREIAERCKTIFENSIIGLSFYTPDGWLLDANKMMREICHFDSVDYDDHFSKTNLFAASPFLECCDPDNLQELWICHQSIVPERDIHDYLETRLHPIRDDEGKVVYIAIATRNVTEERQMYLQSKLNDQQIQRANERIKAYEEELTFMMEACEMWAWKLTFDDMMIRIYKGMGTLITEVPAEELLSYYVNLPEEIRLAYQDPYKNLTKPMGYVAESRSFFNKGATTGWYQINCLPVRDENGKITSAFGLTRNITNMMKKQEQLKHETERANDSGRLKSVFLANMTHEIRTPLNAIVGFSDLLQAVESPDDKKEMIRVIHNNCDMLLRLINDILVLSNVDANAMQLVPKPIDCARDFDDICQSLQQRVQDPNVTFLTDNPYLVCRTCLDNARINQVITNFVTNAVKHTRQGHIRLGYRIEQRNGKDGFYLYCEDTGSGIPKDKQDAVFERFVKLNDYIQGTGLGLSICKAIIEKCEGQIGVESEEGKGSTFWFWIPAQIEEVKEKQTAS